MAAPNTSRLRIGAAALVVEDGEAAQGASSSSRSMREVEAAHLPAAARCLAPSANAPRRFAVALQVIGA